MSGYPEVDPEQMNEYQAKLELDRLAQLIAEYDASYHRDGNSPLSDAEYDVLYRRNQAIEVRFPHLRRRDSPSQRVGFSPSHHLRKVAHREPMLSLESVTTAKGVENFLLRMRKWRTRWQGPQIQRLQIPATQNQQPETDLNVIAEPKVDGLALSLHYLDGQLNQALTRGDGSYGEDVTANTAEISTIPREIPCTGKVEIRGEVYISRSDFAEVNKQRESRGEEILTNARNAAAGGLRQLDSAVTAQRRLRFLAYGWGEGFPDSDSGWELRQRLSELGFQLNTPARLCHSLDEMLDYHAQLEADRPHLPYDIDGAVYKLDSLEGRGQLGSTQKAPRWALAHKFACKLAHSRVRDINFQVGRTGAITPVAYLEPVTIGGAKITRASLHNQNDLVRKDLRIGDQVLVGRVGEVIPQVLPLTAQQAPEHSPNPPVPVRSVPFALPARCPDCGSDLVQLPGQTIWRCSGGLNCPAQVIERLYHFASVIGIKGLGRQQLKFLWHKQLISKPGDLFRLWSGDLFSKPEKLFDFRPPEFGTLDPAIRDSLRSVTWVTADKAMGKKLLGAIETARIIPLDRFICALGIHHIGPTLAQELARHYRSLEAWWSGMRLAHEPYDPPKLDHRSTHRDGDLTPVHDQASGIPINQARQELVALVGAAASESIAHFLSEDGNRAVVDDLYQLAVQGRIAITHPLPALPSLGASKRTISFTGKLETMSRRQAQSHARELGFRVVSTISPSTNFVVAGRKPGIGLGRARLLGITIVDEQQWLSWLDWSHALLGLADDHCGSGSNPAQGKGEH